MNKIFNIIDKTNKWMYNKIAKRKSSDARAITKNCSCDPTMWIIALKNLFVNRQIIEQMEVKKDEKT